MPLMKAYQPLQIHSADGISIGEHKRLVPDIGLDPLHTAAGHRVKPGIYQGHPPGLRIIIMNLHLIICQVKGHIRHVKKIIRKKLLYHILLISQTDNKIMEAEFRIILHNMP